MSILTAGSFREVPEYGEVLHSPSGTTFFVPATVAKQKVALDAQVVTDCTGNVELLKRKLEPGERVFAPIWQLLPHETPFVEPIWLVIPACVGAKRVWQSTAEGWSEVPACFRDGYAEVQLPHFCQLAVTGVAGMIRATGFVSGGSKAKVCFSHIGCSFCEAALTPYFNDSFYLSGYVPCSGVAHLGTRPEHHEVELLQDGISQTVSLESQAFPILSEELVAESTRFSVQIERKRFTFHHSPQDITGHSGAGQAASASHGVAAVSSGPAAPTVAPPVLSAAPAAPATGTDSPSPPSVAPPIFPTAAALMMDERSRTLGESRDVRAPVHLSKMQVSR